MDKLKSKTYSEEELHQQLKKIADQFMQLGFEKGKMECERHMFEKLHSCFSCKELVSFGFYAHDVYMAMCDKYGLSPR